MKLYSGRKIIPSLSYVAVRGEGKMDRAWESNTARSLVWKHFSLSISTQSVEFWYTDFYTTLYFVNQRNYKTLAMQAHAFPLTRYFYSLNVIISHPIVHKEGLGYLSVCAITSRSSPPSHACICNVHTGSELFCVHYTTASPRVTCYSRVDRGVVWHGRAAGRSYSYSRQFSTFELHKQGNSRYLLSN
jgi:hypothetical protein